MLNRIGIVNHTSAGWAAAATYTQMLLCSLEAACRDTKLEIFLLASANDKGISPQSESIKSIPLTEMENLPGERTARRLLGLAEKSKPIRGEHRLRHALQLADNSDVFYRARAQGIDVLLPLLDLPPWQVGVRTIGWVPDFQHVYLPEFFSEEERLRRDQAIRRLAQYATLVMLSSETALEHFKAFAPQYGDKGRVVRFPSLLAFRNPGGNANLTIKKYNLPEKFALVANQFWAHKNHRIVVEALRILTQQGLQVPVVMTGLPVDHRDPSNENFSQLLQLIATAGLSGQVSILGQVPYADLINLMRAAAVVIQPSRFEGWSTVVQDTKALGRPVICSDIAIHREQAPDALGFFPDDEAAALAKLLTESWPRLQPGPDQQNETQALAAEGEFAKDHGALLVNLCREACGG